MKKNVTVNPWTQPSPSPDEVLLHATDWDSEAPYKPSSFMGPPTQQQMQADQWKQQILKQMLIDSLQRK